MRCVLFIFAITQLATSACSTSPDATGADATLSDAGRGDSGDVSDSLATSLVDHDRWVFVAADEDPFDDRLADVVCDEGDGWGVEPLDTEPTVGVDTRFCDYFTASQPLSVEVVAGAPIATRVWHFALAGDGEAHVVVRIGDEDLFERRIPIPSDAELLVDTVPAPRTFEVGEPIYFHVHNHGTNTYNLIDVVAGAVE